MYDSDIIDVNHYILNNKSKFNYEIGQELRLIRKCKKISLEELSYKTMMEPSYIRQIEKGNNGITLSKFIIICNALETKPQEILEDFLYFSFENRIYENFQKEKNLLKNIMFYMKYN